jgi:hypothetical protein
MKSTKSGKSSSAADRARGGYRQREARRRTDDIPSKAAHYMVPYVGGNI